MRAGTVSTPMMVVAPIRRGARRGAEADRPLREDRDRVADRDAAALRPREAGRHDVGAHQHLLVGQPVGYRRQVGHGVGDQHVFGLAAVDRVAEAPAAEWP